LKTLLNLTIRKKCLQCYADFLRPCKPRGTMTCSQGDDAVVGRKTRYCCGAIGTMKLGASQNHYLRLKSWFPTQVILIPESTLLTMTVSCHENQSQTKFPVSLFSFLLKDGEREWERERMRVEKAGLWTVCRGKQTWQPCCPGELESSLNSSWTRKSLPGDGAPCEDLIQKYTSFRTRSKACPGHCSMWISAFLSHWDSQPWHPWKEPHTVVKNRGLGARKHWKKSKLCPLPEVILNKWFNVSGPQFLLL
jgi:hypothetical protein